MNPSTYLCRFSRSQHNKIKICTQFQSNFGNQHNSHSNIQNAKSNTPLNNQINYKNILHLDQNRELKLCLRSDNKDLLIDLIENMAGNNNRYRATKISLPIEQAQQMIQRLMLLAKINFKIEKNITEVSLDRFKETNLGYGVFQQLYTHRIPGLLYGKQKTVFYVSILKFHIDLSMQKSVFEKKSNNYASAKNNGIMGGKNNAPRSFNSQDTLLQPQLFISQHLFNQKEFHVWLPSIYSIQMPVSRVSQFINRMSKIFDHPYVRKWNENAAINNKEREHPNLRRMFSDKNGWLLASNHLIKNE